MALSARDRLRTYAEKAEHDAKEHGNAALWHIEAGESLARSAAKLRLMLEHYTDEQTDVAANLIDREMSAGEAS